MTAPQSGQKFYSQDVTIRGLIPAKYKKDGQNCCMIELQKSDGQGGWLPPLPIGGKANIDTQGWVIPFSGFGPIGYGGFRVRISPLKFNPMDAMAWSPYVNFWVWPKEILEVPVLTQPQANSNNPGAIPIQVQIPAAAQQAQAQCCELEFQLQKQNAWVTVKTLTDNRLGQNDHSVSYDPNAISPNGGGNMRVRARFLKSISGEPLGWSSWREFQAGMPSNAATPPRAAPVNCGLNPKAACH